MKNKTFVLLSAFTLPVLAQANCLEDQWIFRRTLNVTTSECTAKDPLVLTTGEISYPQLGGSYHVKYWQGSFERTVSERDEYIHVILDRCTYGADHDVLRETVAIPSSRKEIFAVENPNLSPDVNASYQLVAMTAAEAAQAFTKAKVSCETAPVVASPSN